MGVPYDYGFRIYNPGIGKFLSVDPLTAQFPNLTPYQFASNRPIVAIDLDGLESEDTNEEMKGTSYDYQWTSSNSETPNLNAGYSTTYTENCCFPITGGLTNVETYRLAYEVISYGIEDTRTDAGLTTAINNINGLHLPGPDNEAALTDLHGKVADAIFSENESLQSEAINLLSKKQHDFLYNFNLAYLVGGGAPVNAIGKYISKYGKYWGKFNWTVDVYRVQRSAKFLSPDKNGNLIYDASKGRGGAVYMTFGDKERALAYLAKKGNGSEIVMFKMDARYVQLIQKMAHPQHLSQAAKAAGQKTLKSINQSDFKAYGLTNLSVHESKMQNFLKWVVPGSAKIMGN